MKYEHAHKEHINAYKMAHMVGTAEYMRERAKDYGLNPDVMYTVGLLHDIGYVDGRADHERYGANILRRMGINDEISFAVMYHGENPYEIQERFGKERISSVFVLLLEADMSVDARGFRVGFEKRLEDIGKRYGYDHAAYETAQENISFIKNYQAEHGIGKPVKLYHKNNYER